MQLNSSEIQEFFDIGYTIKRNLFSQHETQQLESIFDRLQKTSKQFSKPTIYMNTQFVVSGERIDRIVWACGMEPDLKIFARDLRLTLPSSQLLGSSEINHIICQGHFKLPNDSVEFEWHQDSQNRYYGSNEWKDVNGRGSFVQSLVAVDDSTLDGGPLYFIPRSCNSGHLYLEESGNIEKWVDETKAIPLLLNRGDAIFFNPYVIHGSKPNHSNHPRRVFINGFAYPGANSHTYPGCGTGESFRVDRLQASTHDLNRL